MFTNMLSRLLLASSAADSLFRNIKASNYSEDQTFKATLRALFHTRLGKDESLKLVLIPAGARDITSASVLIGRLGEYDCDGDYTLVIVYPKIKECGSQLLEIARAALDSGDERFSGYATQEDLRLFYRKTVNGLFCVSNRGAYIFIDSMTLPTYHALQMMIPKYFPILFADSALTAEESSLLKSIGEKTSTEYELLIEGFAKRLDLRAAVIREQLNGFEATIERKQMERVKSTIEMYREDVKMLLDSIRSKTAIIRDQEYLLAGMYCKLNEVAANSSELMEYFLCNKNLILRSVCDTSIEFIVQGYIDIYDEEAFLLYAGNPKSYLYSDLSNAVTQEGMEKLYRAIFEHGEFKLLICAAYKADFRDTIIPLRDYSFPAESSDYLPNPHIQHYGCIGGYASRFAEYMYNRDYVGGVDQAAVSARNLNFYDSTVIESLAYTLSLTRIKCIEDGAGVRMTPREAIKRLEGEQCLNQSE